MKDEEKMNDLYYEIVDESNINVNTYNGYHSQGREHNNISLSASNNDVDVNVNEILDDDNFFSKFDTDFIENENNVNHTYDTNLDDTHIHTDTILALHVDYSENYNIKMLHHVCNYYNIPKNKCKKDELITRIIDYENNPENSYRVYNRKRYWHYIHELQQDDYFTPFLIELAQIVPK